MSYTFYNCLYQGKERQATYDCMSHILDDANENDNVVFVDFR